METLSYKKEYKSIKSHVCNFCGGRIAIGEKYNKSTHKYDGQIYDWKTHLHCDYLADKLKMYNEVYDEGLSSDAFQETISEEHFSLMIKYFNQDEIKKYSDVIQQLRHVKFSEKLAFVLRHYKK